MILVGILVTLLISQNMRNILIYITTVCELRFEIFLHKNYYMALRSWAKFIHVHHSHRVRLCSKKRLDQTSHCNPSKLTHFYRYLHHNRLLYLLFADMWIKNDMIYVYIIEDVNNFLFDQELRHFIWLQSKWNISL